MEVSDFFNGWHPLLRTLVLGVCAYAGLILMLHISGKRTLAAMNAFDLVVTFAIGSTLATILLSADVSLGQGLLAFAVLLGLQFVMSLTSVHSKTLKKIYRSEPRMLCYQGKVLPKALRKERLTEDELLQVLREHGYRDLESVYVAILETNGRVSVVGDKANQQAEDTLRTVSHAVDDREPAGGAGVDHAGEDRRPPEGRANRDD